MKPKIIATTLIAIWVTTLNAQFNSQMLNGVWHLTAKTNNSPLALTFDEDIQIEPPGTADTPPPPKREPFQEKWVFDGTYVYINNLPSVVRAMTYDFDASQLTLYFPEPEKYELVSHFEDSLVLAIDIDDVFGAYTDTLYFKRGDQSIVDFEKYRDYVYQQALGPFQLHGVYEYLLDVEKIEGLSGILAEGEVVALNIRVFPDSTMLFRMSFFPEGAAGAARCLECSKLDGDILPYPFGVHNLHMENNTFYFQPTTYVVQEGYYVRHEPIEEADQIRFDLFFKDGDLFLNQMEHLGAETDEERFTFIPFHKMNYFFDE